MKKVMSIVLIVLLVLSSVPAFAFSDVESKDWHASFVKEAKELGLINGYKDGSFGPEKSISVGEFIAISINAVSRIEKPLPGSSVNYSTSDSVGYGISKGSFGMRFSKSLSTTSNYPPAPQGTNINQSILPGANNKNNPFPFETFSNLKNKWYYDYVIFAQMSELIKPSEFKESDFERSITRAEMARIIDRTDSIFEEKPIKISVSSQFTDFVPTNYKPYIDNVYNKGIVSGLPNKTFGPYKTATRAEAAIMILKLVKPQHRFK